MSELQARVLSNIHLPQVENFSMRTFGDYLPNPSGGEAWRAEFERRRLSEILPLIPAQEQPDILICASPEYLPMPVDVASFPGLKILLITDWNVCLRFLPDLCPLFDLCFTDWPGFRLLKKAGVTNIRHQPLFGHNPEFHQYQGKTRDLDISFCGNLNSGLHGERNRLLARLAKWGGGKHYLKQAFNHDYLDILNRSKLVFNYSIRGEANMRLFESMATGAVALVEESNQEVAILFQEGKHYFRYAPDKLEACLDSLLAQPAQLEAVSIAAREAVANHSKSKQIQALLQCACREAGGKINPSSLVASKDLSEASLLTGRKALIKLRILGAGYTIQEGMEEIHSLSEDCPGLVQESIPALLYMILSQNESTPLTAVEQMLERYTKGTVLPDSLGIFLQLKLGVLRKNWVEAIALTNHGMKTLASLASTPESIPPLYRYLHPPLDLGKGFNTDLNQAFREDLAGGKRDGYLALLQAHFISEQAKAFFSLGRMADSATLLQSLPLKRFASLDSYGSLILSLFQMGDREGMRRIARAWFSEKPLDTGAWNKIYEAYALLGEKADLIGFLQEISILAEAFLTQEQAEVIKGMLVREQ